MSRKKTAKRAQFEAASNCFHADDINYKGKWNTYFGNDKPITLELGCGKAELSMGLAQKYPDRNFIGIDLKIDRLCRPGKKAIEEGMSNICFVHMHLLSLTEHFAENEVDEIWITFPDPFPKNRHAKHRMINPPFLKLYQEVLKPDGVVQYKTDNLPLFQYSLEVFVAQPQVKMEALSFDLHGNEDLPEEIKIQTHYEKLFRAEGFHINYVKFRFV